MANHKAIPLPTNWADPMIEVRQAVERACESAEQGFYTDALHLMSVARIHLGVAQVRLERLAIAKKDAEL